MSLPHNLFVFAPRELSHSAFWAWVLQALDTDEDRLAAPRALALDVLREFGVSYPGGPVNVTTECPLGKDYRVDIAVRFANSTSLLVECKRSAPVSPRQIRSYQEAAEDGVVVALLTTHFDEQAINTVDAPALSTSEIANLLSRHQGRHAILDEYAEWVYHLQERRSVLCTKALSDDAGEVHEALETRIGQWHLMRQITADMEGMYSRGTNKGGTPWTQFAFSDGKGRDRLFYRIDCYTAGFYVSLRQYLGDKDHSAWDGKKERLDDLRRWWKEAVSEVKPNLRFKAPHNQGKKESEVACLMLKDNKPRQIVSELPAVHKAFVRCLRRRGWHIHT